MEFRSRGRRLQLSFDTLSKLSSNGDLEDALRMSTSSTAALSASESDARMRKRRNRGSRKRRKKATDEISTFDHPIAEDECGFAGVDDLTDVRCENEGVELEQDCVQSAVFQEALVPQECGARTTAVEEVAEAWSSGKLRQRNWSGSGGRMEEVEVVSSSDVPYENGKEVDVKGIDFSISSNMKKSELNENGIGRLETVESLDWKQIMAEDPHYQLSVGMSPFKYFLDEMCSGNSLRNTAALADENERERVYDTIFRLPWRCEMLIDVGFFVCLNSFLAVLTIMPTRILIVLWRLLKTQHFKMLSAAELSDFGCFAVMFSGVALLELTDISLIYHMIRGQGTIKLYVLYNILEIFDKLWQNLGGDVLQTLFGSAEELASSSIENKRKFIGRFISDLAVAVVSSIVHSFILLAQAITFSTCIIAHNNALLALLISNNFAEIKSSVFKRFSKENIHSMVYFDSIERFHISAFVLFVLAQNIMEAEGPWFANFLMNAAVVYICEMMIDIVKHSFIAKFNGIKPIAYSEFLEELCNQTLNTETASKKNRLTFIPLAPACVVIRVLTPVYAAHLPYSPLMWRLMWILILSAITYVMLASLKVLISLGLQKHATWYISRCQRRKHHMHAD
uniref:Protein POLLEN DEFECTIVE IN GUIDANCE 1 n=1 Tax=Kalanchoe fedtschenkoi TaxID=63787 RepID=A0A7N0TFV3_KALFE